MSQLSNIYELAYNSLKSLGYPVKEQGTFPKDNLPETYITYFLISDPNETHYDNKPESTTYRIQLCIYSKKPSIKQNGDTLFKSVMIPGGFLRVGGRDLPFNANTGHYCYTCDYKYFYREQNESEE